MNLQTIRASARTKADEGSDGFISDTELNRFINQGQNFIYGKICQRFEDFFIVPGDLSNGGLFYTVAGQQSYPLPTSLMKLVKTEFRAARSTNDNEWSKLDRTNISNNRLDEYYPIRDGYRPGFGYFSAGGSIYLRPVPTDAMAIRLWFIPRPDDLVGDNDTPVVPDEYHELIAEYAAIQALRKSGESIWKESNDLFVLELNNLLENIEIRDQQAEQMTITDDVDYYRNGL